MVFDQNTGHHRKGEKMVINRTNESEFGKKTEKSKRRGEKERKIGKEGGRK
jgi:hypothetical protein